MGITSLKDYGEKVVVGGQQHTTYLRKTAVATTANVWFDASVLAGHPPANFYAATPLQSATLESRLGINHGISQAPNKKYLKTSTFLSPTSVNRGVCMFYDTLMYYPFIDGDETGLQTFNNSISLPRFETGEGVYAFLVAQSTYIGGGGYQIEYTNSDGQTGRFSPVCRVNTSGIAGALANSSGSTPGANEFGWHLPLVFGDKGIRSVQSIQFDSAIGGIFALVLVKPIAFQPIYDGPSPNEVDFLLSSGFSLPEIHNNAYLNFIYLFTESTANQNLTSAIQIVWG